MIHRDLDEYRAGRVLTCPSTATPGDIRSLAGRIGDILWPSAPSDPLKPVEDDCPSDGEQIEIRLIQMKWMGLGPGADGSTMGPHKPLLGDYILDHQVPNPVCNDCIKKSQHIKKTTARINQTSLSMDPFAYRQGMEHMILQN